MTARRRKRGAALVEAVVALPIFVALLAALCYFERLYDARLSAAGAARAAVWQASLQGCEGHGTGSDLPLPAVLESLASAAGAARLLGAPGTTHARERRHVSREAVLGLPAADVAAVAELVCNERASTADQAGVLRAGWNRARPW